MNIKERLDKCDQLRKRKYGKANASNGSPAWYSGASFNGLDQVKKYEKQFGFEPWQKLDPKVDGEKQTLQALFAMALAIDPGGYLVWNTNGNPFT